MNIHEFIENIFFFSSDRSFLFKFTNYTKRQTISTYINGLSFKGLRGFEEVVSDNTTTYYILGELDSVVIAFNQNWIFIRTYNSPDSWCYCLKYVLGYFYITSGYKLYKTDSKFNVISSNTEGSAGAGKTNYYYRGIYYDDIISVLYVVSWHYECIDVFNTSLSFLYKISLAGYSTPYSINKFKGNLYVGASSEILVVQNGTVSKIYNIDSCKVIYSQSPVLRTPSIA